MLPNNDLSELSILDEHNKSHSFDLLQQPRQTENMSSQISCSDMHFAKVYERLEREGPLETENMTHLTT